MSTETLENKNYLKILELVVRDRHPEVESFEEAVKLESGANEQYFVTKDGIGYHFNAMLYFNPNIIQDLFNQIQMAPRSINFSRLITVSDILELLSKNIDTKKYLIDKETKVISIYHNLKPITLEDILVLCKKNGIMSPSVISDLLKHWQLTKPLHEQTPQNWEKIVSIICK